MLGRNYSYENNYSPLRGRADRAFHSCPAAQPALTIYNQNFAVVRDSVPLDLKQGVNDVRFTETTAHLEPDSVILRDPQGKTNLQILEQNYRNDPVSQELLLSLFEGKAIEFETDLGWGQNEGCAGQNHSQRLRPALAVSHAALRAGVLPIANGDGCRHRAADHRGRRQTAVFASRAAAFPGSGR